MQSEVTVIIPNLNGAQYLNDSIKSVINQDYPCEILVIDNGSTDSSLQILKELHKNFSNVNFLVEPRKSISMALNLGISKAKTEYIARLDSDDVMVENRISSQLKQIKYRDDIILVGSNIILIDENGHDIGIRKYPSEDYKIKNALIYKNPIAHPAVLMKRKYVLACGGYNPRFDGVEDLDLWLRLKEYGAFCSAELPLTKYRIHQNQETQKSNLYRKELKLRFEYLRVNPIRLKISTLLRLLDLLFMSVNFTGHRTLLRVLKERLKQCKSILKSN